MKIRPVGAELFLVDRRTDMTKLTVAFRNFANAPKNTPNYIIVTQTLITHLLKYMTLSTTKRVHQNDAGGKKDNVEEQYSTWKTVMTLNNQIRYNSIERTAEGWPTPSKYFFFTGAITHCGFLYFAAL